MKFFLNFVLIVSLFVASAPVFSAEAEYEYTDLWLGMEHKMAHLLMVEHAPILTEEHNGIMVGDWVKTNSDYNKAQNSRVAGKIVKFLYKGEAYPIALLRGGKQISVFWLEKMRTQNRP